MNPETMARRIEATAARQRAALKNEADCLAKAKVWREAAVRAGLEWRSLSIHPDAPSGLVPVDMPTAVEAVSFVDES